MIFQPFGHQHPVQQATLEVWEHHISCFSPCSLPYPWGGEPDGTDRSIDPVCCNLSVPSYSPPWPGLSCRNSQREGEQEEYHMSVVQIEDVAALLEQHHPAILAYLSWVLSQDAQEREDIAQEACLRAYRAIARGQVIQAQSFRPWLYRIAHHVAIDLWRHRSSLTLVPLEEMEQPQQSSTEERVIERNEITLVLSQ